MQGLKNNLTVLSLGSNMGDKMQNIRHAIQALEKRFDSKASVSNFYLTEPIGYLSNEKFLNAAVIFPKTISPQLLLDWIFQIESNLGRVRDGDNITDRSIDIDILFIGDQIINQDGLIIPHPRLAQRNFVLIPLMDLVPEFEHPILKKPIWEIYDECMDEGEISEFE